MAQRRVVIQLTSYVVFQVSHSVSIILELPGTDTKLIHVECKEPQTIYELLIKHNISCSQVWNEQMCLSARGPCLALVEHNMRIINVNTVPWTDEKPAVEQNVYYHNMKCIKVNTRDNVMRHKPYAPPKRSDSKYRPSCSSTEHIPVGIYYQNSMSKLKDVIKQDGRFIDSLEVAQLPTHLYGAENPYPVDSHMGIGQLPVLELEPDTTLLIGKLGL